MSLLPPRVLQKLARSRLQPIWATPRAGVGERRSRAKGSGIEFADHREYQPGDDIRHLDRHAYSRLGRHVIKQYSLYQQLQVTVLIDSSASMGFGTPAKLRRAAELAGIVAYAGLSGGDRVLVGAFSGGSVKWHRHLEGTRRAAALFRWLEQLRPEGSSRVAESARASARRLGSSGLLVVISDWLDDGLAAALSAWRRAGQELVGVRLLAPEELEPERMGDGPVRLFDVESGQEVEASLDAGGYASYRKALADWERRLRDALFVQEGRLFSVRSDDDLERTVLTEWRVKQLIS
ncbi:MAG: DUF58 domain-containing protein [Trueperaceae bacterium]